MTARSAATTLGAVLATWLAAAPGPDGAAAQPVSDDDARSGAAVPLGADRPSFSVGPAVVGRGRLQVEAGYLYARDDDGWTHTAPLLLLRAGIGGAAEARLAWGGVAVEDERGGGGAGDVVLGVKAGIAATGRGLPAVGFLGQVSLPSGDGDASSGSVDPTVGLLWSHDLPGDINASLFGNVLLRAPTRNSDGRFVEAIPTLGLALDLTDRISTFAEYFATFPTEGATMRSADAGISYLLGRNLQIDAVVGGGLDEDATDLFVGAGIAYRWDWRCRAARPAQRGSGVRT